ncbi:MAG: vanadium-dependent haloperoxidase [Acidimicrobiia bacterium]|nr:vanadium-dependent haloperoxidase [Acidimicrobiia bacterium]NNF09877.1 vanadium-dependent haloperoxidase [Acidimicrobiia bacterium]
MTGQWWRLAAGTLLASIALFGALVFLSDRGEPPMACPPVADNPDWSVARRWNEALLDAIRRDVPAPTVHARNLFHTSAAMWDAWAAYDPDAIGYLVNDTLEADDVAGARAEAISYAAFGILESRYLLSVGAEDTITQILDLMDTLCFPVDEAPTEGSSPAAVGNRIAAAYIAHGLLDGSNEADNYLDPDYAPLNPPLVVDQPGTAMVDPNRWQPLQIEQMISQNGIPVSNGVQEFIDSHWGDVAGFALAPGAADGLPVDPGPPPYLGDPATDAAFKDGAIEVIGFSSLLDPTGAAEIDISPATVGNTPVGTYDSAGYSLNPVTGSPYEPNLVNEADFARVLAEFWADGPDSETPPGHWNTLANTVSDTLDPDLRVGGAGEPVGRLEWDVKLYFALNGAAHDAAIAAWGAKGHYDYVRPISMIRHMGGLGQSSDHDGPSYHPDGLPLVDGLVEVVTAETTAPGARHVHLAGHEGEIAVRAWAGTPDDPERETAGVDWIRAVEWVPYQKPSFVTPAFAGYISGHSTFSRAAAEVLAGITGSEYFPGGLGEWTIPAGSLEFEAGPAGDITLQWAAYADAADQAGISRLYGGIHVRADDLAGRVAGEQIGIAAWNKASTYFGG